MKVRVDFEFFKTPAGSVYELIENTYEKNICDCCGNARKCDFFRLCDEEDPARVTFLDMCRKCQKDHAEVVE